MIRTALLLALLATPATAQDRIVAIGGAVTEIVFALGQQHRLVARDSTSNHPPAAAALPDVGYIRQLSPEGVMSVAPDLILSEPGAGPPEAVELLRQAAIPFVEIPDGFDRAAILARIEAVGEALGVGKEAAALAQATGERLDAAMEGGGAGGKRVLFILSMQGGRIMASGTGTSADGIIRLAGAVNAVDGFTGYRPLTDEAVAAAAPDLILMMTRDGDHAVADEALFAHPAVVSTPAARDRAVVRMDGMYLLGFSVRTPEAVRDLVAALNGASGH